MKRVWVCCCLTFGVATLATAQFEVHVYGGANFSDRFNVSGGNAKIFGGGIFGGSIWYRTRSGVAVEVEYLRQSADAEVVSSQLIDYDIRLGMNYLLAGAHWLFESDKRENIDFNLGLKGGVTGILPQGDRYNDIWRFTLAGNAGMRYDVSDRIGVRAQIHILMPIQFAAGAFWLGNGGSGVGVTQFTTITQLGGIVGIYYRFGYE